MIDVTSADSARSFKEVFSNRMRIRRAARLRALIDAVWSERGRCRIVDLGGTRRYWQSVGIDYLRARNVSVLLVNRVPEACPDAGNLFESVRGDALNLPGLEDCRFDIAHSNSVIEHVGGWKEKAAFAREAQRLGRRHYVQTPNYWFPVEPHMGMPLIHFLPKPLQVRLIMLLRLNGWDRARHDAVDAIRLAEGADMLDARAMQAFFPHSRIEHEVIWPFTKSFIAIGDYVPPALSLDGFSETTVRLLRDEPPPRSG